MKTGPVLAQCDIRPRFTQLEASKTFNCRFGGVWLQIGYFLLIASWMNDGTSEVWEEVESSGGVDDNALDVIGSESGRLRGLSSSGKARIALLTDSLLTSTNALSC